MKPGVACAFRIKSFSLSLDKPNVFTKPKSMDALNLEVGLRQSISVNMTRVDIGAQIGNADLAFVMCRFGVPNDKHGCVDSVKYENLSLRLPSEFDGLRNRRKTEFLAGRMCAMLAARQVGSKLPDLAALSSGEPDWPIGLSGSISHSDERACAVVRTNGDSSRIGVDIERIYKNSDIRQLSRFVLSDVELEELLLWQPDLPILFTSAFSAKEAAYKAVSPFVADHLDLRSIRLLPRGDNTFDVSLLGEMFPRIDSPPMKVNLYYESDFVISICA